MTAEQIILTHLIDVAYYRYHILARHDGWKWSVWTGEVAQSSILWSHIKLMRLWKQHIMWIILIKITLAFSWHPQKKLNGNQSSSKNRILFYPHLTYKKQRCVCIIMQFNNIMTNAKAEGLIVIYPFIWIALYLSFKAAVMFKFASEYPG